MIKPLLRMFWWSTTMKIALILMSLGTKIGKLGKKLFTRSTIKWMSAFMAMPPEVRTSGLSHMAEKIVKEINPTET